MREAINKWETDSRPREKLIAHGPEALETAELIAILLGSGSRESDAVTLAREMLESCGNSLTDFSHLTYDELISFKGIGPAKAVGVLAALELSRRRMAADIAPKRQFTTPEELYEFFKSKMCNQNREVFWVLLLNNRLQRIDDRCISRGDVKSTVAEPRMIFNYVVSKQATAFAVAHNHPGGSPKPSEADRQLTRRIAAVAKELGVKFIDHIVVCDGRSNYYSFMEEGLI